MARHHGVHEAQEIGMDNEQPHDEAQPETPDPEAATRQSPPVDDAETTPESSEPETPEPETPERATRARDTKEGRTAGEGEEQDEEQFEIPPELPILPLKDTVVYPFAVMPLGVGKERSIRLIDEVMRGSRLVGLVAQKDAEVEEAGPEDCFRIGTVARIARLLRIPDGTMQIIVQGLERFVVDEWVGEQPFLRAKVHAAPDTVEGGVEVEAIKRTAIDLFQRLVNLVQYLPDQLAMAVMNLDDPRQVVYLIASSAQMDLELRQKLLEVEPVRAKLEMVTAFLTRELEVLELGKKIQSQAQEEMTKAQREYFLREQLKAIQKELGEESDEAATVNELRAKIEQAHMPEEALKEAQRELSRLERIPTISPEYSVIRTYIELLVSLPWDKSTGQAIDVAHAREVLDEDHYDLEKIKDRILEYLAVRKLKEDRQGSETGGPGTGAPTSREPILCFVGPPGVGKTSLGHSIARALGRHFVRMSLGGIHDEAEIRGHRRTYIGAMPGRILQAIRRADTNDPVFMLDEVDKVTADWRGDPSAALLEVLDPEQNHAFRDNYLDLPFDLSHVMFIATANALDPIPAPLRDRMEVLELAGYTEEEKLHIARRFLLSKQLAANGLAPDELELPDETIRRIIRGYTREAGVRGLEREIGAVCRKIARRIAEDRGEKRNTEAAAQDEASRGSKEPAREDRGTQVPAQGAEGDSHSQERAPALNSQESAPPSSDHRSVVTPERLHELLGRPRFFDEAAERIDRPGIVTGLVWTPVGGDIIFVEAAMMPSAEERLTLTGQLGEVMKESAMAALSYVRSNAELLGIDPRIFEHKTFHIHVPEGAIPKDGPSAGVTMMTAIASLATGRQARSDVAMTGEISLRGKVLPIGGLKEKVLAAHRAGIRTVILPRRNEYDLEDLPKDLRAEMTFEPVDDARQVLALALEGGLELRTRDGLPRAAGDGKPEQPEPESRGTGLVASQSPS
jgi:ATP-dependent Lon protease